MSAEKKLVNVDAAGNSPIFDVTEEDVERARKAIKAPDTDTVVSMMGIIEPPFASRLKLKDEGGENKHERGK